MSQVQELLFETLNKAAHTLLSVDPDTAAAFGQLKGKLFCIELTVPALTIYLTPEPDGLFLAAESDQSPDVTLSGTIFAFAKLGSKGAASGVMTDGQVSMNGDAEAGQVLQKILAEFDLDWEELIARLLGDTAARKVGNMVRGTADWVESSVERSKTNLAEYLSEEKKILATETAMRRFENAVSTVRADSDRLAQRIDRIRRSIG